MILMSVPIAADRTCNRFRTSLYSARTSSEYSQTKCSSPAQRWSRSALGTRPGMYCFRKPEMPATTTFVSTTARCLRFLDFGCNGDLRSAPFSAIAANRALDFLFGNLPYVLGRIGKRIEELLLPSGPFPPARQVAVEFCPAHTLLDLLPERSKGNAQLDRLLSSRKAAGKYHVLRVFLTKPLFGGAKNSDEPGETI